MNAIRKQLKVNFSNDRLRSLKEKMAGQPVEVSTPEDEAADQAIHEQCLAEMLQYDLTRQNFQRYLEETEGRTVDRDFTETEWDREVERQAVRGKDTPFLRWEKKHC